MKKLRKITIVVVGVLAVGAVVVVLVSPDNRKLDESVREESGTAFVRLSEGLTEYELAGPESGEPVVLIHGLSVPMFDWDRQFRVLADSGFRVLRYNQYGRGLSDRPRGEYDKERYVRQLKDLIDTQGWNRVNLVGHSMGCGVAAEFAVRHPESVDQLVLISPVLHMADGNAGITLVKIPLVGGLAAKAILPGILASRAEGLFLGAGVPEAAEYTIAFREQMEYRGFTRSVKSLFRNDLVEDLSPTYGQLNGSQVLSIRGTRDESVTPAHFETIVDVIPEMKTVVLDGIGHMPNMEDAEETTALIVEFLRR